MRAARRSFDFGFWWNPVGIMWKEATCHEIIFDELSPGAPWQTHFFWGKFWILEDNWWESIMEWMPEMKIHLQRVNHSLFSQNTSENPFTPWISGFPRFLFSSSSSYASWNLVLMQQEGILQWDALPRGYKKLRHPGRPCPSARHRRRMGHKGKVP